MKNFLSAILLISFTSPLFAQKPASLKPLTPKPKTETTATNKNEKAEKASLPIKKVILYNHGVGYFERQGSVIGSQLIDLQFNSGQMNDVLKSLLVLDLNGGLISTVTYDTSKPIERQLAEFSISLADSNQRGLTTLIAQMRGADVEVKTATGAIDGKVVGLEKRRQMQGQNVIEIDALVLSTDAGDVRTFDLSEIKGIKILDPKLRADLAHYLEILNGKHKKDSRNLVISAQGEGKRSIRAGYTIEAPVWKTTYRIVIDDKNKPYLQGWAVVDNEQDEDWENVELSLVSGLPVSFIQDIQSARYRRRPQVPFKEDLALSPQTYEEALTTNKEKQPQNSPGGNVASGFISPPSNRNNNFQVDGVDNNDTDSQRIDNLPINGRNFQNFALTTGKSVQAETVGRNVGELFAYKVNHTVTIKRNSSALIPIVTDNVDGERVSIFNEASGIRNPMSGVLLHNTTGLTLESGPLTVFEGDTYAGEGLIDRLKPDEKRFLTYAADLGTTVSTKFESSNDNVATVQIIKGTIITSYKGVENKTYTILNKDDKAKTVIIEHSNRADWKLKSPAEAFETTENFRRFRVVAAPKATTKFTVNEEAIRSESIAVSDIDSDRIVIYVNRKYIDEATRQKLAKTLELKQQINKISNEIELKEAQINEIDKDQARIRENLKAVGKSEEEKKLISRYTTKLNQGEDELERLRKEIKVATEMKNRLDTELEQFILSINFNTDTK